VSTDPADELYDAIREDEHDIEEISQRTGLNPANVLKVKRHLFFDEHYLDRYESLGVPGYPGRFDSDAVIAAAWNRLKSGTFTPLDLRLLRHQAAEAWFMRRHGPSYRKAHEAAQRRYPVPSELWA
jgi:hypothetical protein